MEEAKGFQPSRSAAQQVSRKLHEIMWLRFVHFKYHFLLQILIYLPLGENFRIPEWSCLYMYLCAFRNLMRNLILLINLSWPPTQPTKKKRYKCHAHTSCWNLSITPAFPWMSAGCVGPCTFKWYITYRARALKWKDALFDCFGSLWIMNQQ